MLRAALARGQHMPHNPPPAAASPPANVSCPAQPAHDDPPPAAPGAAAPAPQPRLDLDPEGVQRIVWESRYGPILIELVGDAVLVNGERVEPANLSERPGA
jgi:hypothetical protein